MKSRGKKNRRSNHRPRKPAGRVKRDSRTRARVVKPDIHREISYITKRAQEGDARVVTLGKLVLFSSSSRDAWLLDAEEEYALCVCRGGEAQPISILETPDTVAIEWTATFAIEGAAFIVQDRAGRVVVIDGYPTVEIAAACGF